MEVKSFPSSKPTGKIDPERLKPPQCTQDPISPSWPTTVSSKQGLDSGLYTHAQSAELGPQVFFVALPQGALLQMQRESTLYPVFIPHCLYGSKQPPLLEGRL